MSIEHLASQAPGPEGAPHDNVGDYREALKKLVREINEHMEALNTYPEDSHDHVRWAGVIEGELAALRMITSEVFARSAGRVAAAEATRFLTRDEQTAENIDKS